MKRLITLFLLMVVLSTRSGWTMENDKSNDESIANIPSEVAVEIRNFAFDVVGEEIQRTETILGRTLDQTYQATIIQAAMMKLKSGESETAQDDYDKLIATAREAGDDNNSDRANAIAQATWIAILHPTITTDQEIRHGLLLRSAHISYAKWVPLNFI